VHWLQKLLARNAEKTSRTYAWEGKITKKREESTKRMTEFLSLWSWLHS